jgi:hypothetical protein
MNNYQFRTNWRGKLILQRLRYRRDRWGDKYGCWQDATTQDLKDYYEQLCNLQKTPTCQELRSLFDSESG